MSLLEASPVLTSTKKGTAYLEIIPHGNKVRVQRTDAGKTLNKFWTVWLRQLLMEQTDRKHGFAVELRGSSVLVSSNTSPEGLMETVRAMAARIVPLSNPPMTRWGLDATSSFMPWRVKDEVDLTECLKSLRLPRGAHVTNGRWLMSLKRSQKCPFRISELALMVEYHVATTWTLPSDTAA
jgi:hypothetical protein